MPFAGPAAERLVRFCTLTWQRSAMSRNYSADWLALVHDSYWLWAESLMVIGVRTTDMLMRAPGHEREAVRMVAEKLRANAELTAEVATAGALTPEKAAHKVVKHYRKKVTANRKRLARRKPRT